MLLVFEDDARPQPQAVHRLVDEVAKLDRQGFAWDLIYVRASLYSRQPEEPLAPEVPGSSLLWARHRKVTDAYCLSRRGIARIAGSGFRESLFAFDDFLPALHSDHPRRAAGRCRPTPFQWCTQTCGRPGWQRSTRICFRTYLSRFVVYVSALWDLARR